MLDNSLIAVMVLFALGAGGVIGTGARGDGFARALSATIAGAVTGVLLCIPFWKDLTWTQIAVCALITTIGSIGTSFLPEHNWFRKLCSQLQLQIRLGKYYRFDGRWID